MCRSDLICAGQMYLCRSNEACVCVIYFVCMVCGSVAD